MRRPRGNTKQKYMKHILLLISVATLLTATGCIFPNHRGGGDYDHPDHYRGSDDEGRGHGEYREHSEYRGYPESTVDVRIHG